MAARKGGLRSRKHFGTSLAPLEPHPSGTILANQQKTAGGNAKGIPSRANNHSAS